MDYETRRISTERQSDLFGLFESAFGAVPAPEALSSKHDTGFAGTRDIGLIAYATDGQPAGYYGVFPVKARIKGEVRLLAQSGDTMVHQAHGGKGLFTTLAKRTYEIARAEKIEGVFGFPSPSSYPGFVRKLDWQHHENIQRFRFLVPTPPLSELLWRYRPARRWLVKWQRFLFGMFDPADKFSGSLMDGDFDCIERSDGYWAYKLAQREVMAIRVAGVDTVIKLEGSLGLGDVDTTDPKRLRRIIRQLKLFCFFAGIHRINTYLSPGSPLADALATLAAPVEGLPIGYVDFSDRFSQRNLRYCYLDMDTF